MTGSGPTLTRGYSTFPAVGSATVKNASTYTNVIIKKKLPARGVVSSNPKRMERLLKCASELGLLENIQEHTNIGWGVEIYTAKFREVEIFVAAVPMGSAGSGFAFFEMFAAGAQAMIRYGSNDRSVEMENLNDFVIVDEADNLFGLCHSVGSDDCFPLKASEKLIKILEENVHAEKGAVTIKRMICHNVEDYHAYNFPHLFDSAESIKDQIDDLETTVAVNGSRRHCWDMETAALFWRAKQFGLHAATVLQNLIKKPGTSPYEGEHGRISLAMEASFYRLIFDSLCKFSPSQVDEPSPPSQSGRAFRRYASSDLVGVEEPLTVLQNE